MSAASGSDRVAGNLDEASAAEVVAAVLAAQETVLPAVRAAAPEIAAAADLVATTWRAGGRLILVGAGTSGRVAWQEAAELPGTFGLAREQVVGVLAGGFTATDGAEDDLDAARRDLARVAPGAQDVVVAVAASGTTPYTLAFAQDVPARVVAVVTRRGSPLERAADVTVCTEVGDEVLRGSTRLGAGTAQKLALDALTTAAAARLGRVHGNLMIDVVPANAKLRDRAAGVVAEIAGTSTEQAHAALDAADGDARAAVLVLLRGLDPHSARERARAHETLRRALDT